MTPPRAPLVALVLLTLVSSGARAQQWGGSPPATTTSRATTRTVPATRTTVTPGRAVNQRVSLIDPNAYSFVFGAAPAGGAASSSGGSWNGGGAQWGGSPPSSVANQAPGGAARNAGTHGPRRPMIAAADSPALAPDAPKPVPTPPARTRAQQYLMERARP
jgi:hypothetical protein